MPYGAPEGSFLYWVTRRSAASTGQIDARPIAAIRMMLLGFIIMTLPEITPLPSRAACREHASVGSGDSDVQHGSRIWAPRLLRLDAGVPGLVQCRQLRKQRATLQARHRECAQRPGSDVRNTSREIGEHHRHATCKYVLDGRR